MLSLQHVSKYYQAGGNKNFVLNDISLDIDEKEFISIMGPSGSGKSTLLNVIGMLDEATVRRLHSTEPLGRARQSGPIDQLGNMLGQIVKAD